MGVTLISNLGWHIKLVTQAVWVSVLYFLHMLFDVICTACTVIFIIRRQGYLCIFHHSLSEIFL
jgi:hypothetical protein